MLRRRVVPPPSPPRQSVVVCTLGGRDFAVPAPRVLDVAQITTYTPLPSDDPANLGVVIHRGRVISLVDLAPRLGVPRIRPPAPPGLCLFVTTGRGELGFPIDQVSGVAAGTHGVPEGVALLDPDGWGGSNGQGAAG